MDWRGVLAVIPSLTLRTGSERSEGSLRPSNQTLRCAQSDRHDLHMSEKTTYILTFARKEITIMTR